VIRRKNSRLPASSTVPGRGPTGAKGARRADGLAVTWVDRPARGRREGWAATGRRRGVEGSSRHVRSQREGGNRNSLVRARDTGVRRGRVLTGDVVSGWWPRSLGVGGKGGIGGDQSGSAAEQPAECGGARGFRRPGAGRQTRMTVLGRRGVGFFASLAPRNYSGVRGRRE